MKCERSRWLMDVLFKKRRDRDDESDEGI